MPHLPHELTSLLRRQHSVVSRRQVLDLGVEEDRLEEWVRRRLFEIVHRGIYRPRGSAPTPEQAAMAGVLRARDGARITGPFVLGLLNVEGFTRTDPFEVLVPGRRRVENVPFPVRRAHVPPDQRATISGIPAVTPTRSFVDSARTVAGKRLVPGLDSARWLDLTDPLRVLGCARALGRRDLGAARVLDLLGDGVCEQESSGERALAAALVGFEPQPDWGVWVTPRRRADGLWRDVLLVLEYLGERHHGHELQRRGDRIRDEELRSAGYDVAYVTADDLRAVPALRARLAAHRHRRAVQLGIS
jgi:hypothetical protein